EALTYMGQNRRAVFGVCVNLRTLCQGFGNPASRDVSHLRELMKPVRTGIEIIVLELIGGRMRACGIVNFIKSIDVLDMDDRPGARAMVRNRAADYRGDQHSDKKPFNENTQHQFVFHYLFSIERINCTRGLEVGSSGAP